MRTPILTSVLVALVLALAACGGDDQAPSGSPPASSATGPGLSIADARASDLTGALLVNGNLLVEGDEVRLCEALAESFPPQCGGDSLRVEGLDLATVESLTTSRDVSWTDRPIQLLGVVRDGTITVSNNATA